MWRTFECSKSSGLSIAWHADLLTTLVQCNTFMRLKPVVSIGLRDAHKSVNKWLNETFPTRVLVVFASGPAVVVLRKALQGLIG
jgi:hypothetical protein